MEMKELVEKHKDVMLEAAEAYLNALKELNKNADEIDVITEILKGMGYEYHKGQVMPNSPDISVHHFISKDEKYIIQLVLSEADEEAIASIRQDED